MAKDVLEVLERMRKQAMLGRLPDDQISNQELIRLTDEDRAATLVVAELIAAAGNPDLNCIDTAAIPRRKRQQALAELCAALAACRGL